MSDQSADDRRGAHGSVAEEMAALAEALRARAPRRDTTGAADGPESDGDNAGHRHSEPLDTCEICPVCRSIAALHTISPGAVSALADLAHQAEVTLRALAMDLQRHQDPPADSTREDIPVDDLDADLDVDRDADRD